MGVLRRVWAAPPIWRYIAVGAIAFAVGGAGVTQASELLNVLVVNSPSQPVPVNDSNANTGLGTANSSLSSIDSKLGGTLSVGGTVAVSNPPSHISVDNIPALKPIELKCFVSVAYTKYIGSTICPESGFSGYYVVPTGETLVVQSISVSCEIESGLQINQLVFNFGPGTLFPDFVDRGPVAVSTDHFWTGNTSVTAYAPAGSIFQAGIYLNGTASPTSTDVCYFYVSGGLINAS